jgi:hypothetical protein
MAIFVALAAPAGAHALDEYLQAVLIGIEKDRITISLRLVPGVAVLPDVLRGMDGNGDGDVSIAERQSYPARVRDDLHLSLNGKRLPLRLISADIPAPKQLAGGVGQMRMEFMTGLPPAPGQRRLVLENRHQSRIAAYLVNSLATIDPDIRLLAQRRNVNQSFYQLDYVQAGSMPRAAADDWSGFGAAFRLGMHHIAEGADHLLFLLALLLPAPLLARQRRWNGSAGISGSLLRIIGVVTGFTLGHSFTLVLAGLGLVRVPGMPVEVLIAVSILISAIHALRPLFPGREVAIAAFFGLIHGLAFATVLDQLGLGSWDRMVNLLGFNLGIELVQLLAVAAILPSLLLLSRTQAYALPRIAGALFAALAALAWIAERLLGWETPVDFVVGAAAFRAPLLAGLLFLVSLAWWGLARAASPQPRT